MGDLEDLRTLVRAFIEERDWVRFHNAKDLSAAIAIEAAELQEVFLWKTREEADAAMRDPEARRRVEAEVADVMIFLLSLADRYGVDLAAAVERKVRENAGKYPADKVRGRAVKYTELKKE
ncbi:MAG: nucleotide pyrophosphohydrolase [Thermoplasmata archaeon]|nr:nucleotide pyrophosphohydrolase [Thermoplasmata archaeon]